VVMFCCHVAVVGNIFRHKAVYRVIRVNHSLGKFKVEVPLEVMTSRDKLMHCASHVTDVCCLTAHQHYFRLLVLRLV